MGPICAPRTYPPTSQQKRCVFIIEDLTTTWWPDWPRWWKEEGGGRAHLYQLYQGGTWIIEDPRIIQEVSDFELPLFTDF